MGIILETDTLMVDGALLYTSYQKAIEPRQDRLTVVILHGAGQSTSERFTDIGSLFLEKGISVIALDFIGHGKTGGSLQDNSLSLRTKHTLAVIAHWVDQKTPLILLGSSMGAHTALRVSKQLGDRIQGLCLLQPAIYANDAEDVLFTEKFTTILRRPGSWQSSYALEDARVFTGKVYMGIGSIDHIIPWSVVEKLTGAFRQNAASFRLEIFHDVAHTLPEWIPNHAFYGKQMVEFFTNTI